ncbi:MAG: hypothetical protein R3F42_12730 [Pseudomonadota bacterium]
MNTRDTYSDEQLQAFVDDEIELGERAEIMEAMRHDEELACRVCELLQTKDAVKLAYREPEQPAQRRHRWQNARTRQFTFRAAAAGMIFAVGAATGMLLQTHSSGTTTLADAQETRQETRRVIIHVSTMDGERMEQALDDAEEMLVNYQDHPERVQLEVIANAEGLALLRQDKSPYVERIRRLTRRFSNISFLACNRSIEKLHMRGVDVHLIPEARVIPGALEAIVDRLQQGWVYIRV